ncbi:hypothetical protein NPIL_124561 [Nephila pilipes]|uniref:Uncharacterized protein n=1 Tax=Nephila pilipes TaxID=299642 RepID=A0A8X6P7N0_NEPPI|nr:hypothetical protein NPIL_124561 [Nephila pilipes]
MSEMKQFSVPFPFDTITGTPKVADGNEKDDDKYEDNVPTTRVSHADAENSFVLALHFIEQSLEFIAFEEDDDKEEYYEPSPRISDADAKYAFDLTL